MDIVIAGGHGKVAMRLHRILVGRGHKVLGLIRDPGQAGDLAAAGALPVLCDLEQLGDISELVGPADAVIFAAGSGPGSGAERKRAMYRDGANKLIASAKDNGIRRSLMMST
ncbi:MAG: NAD(P)H-binding protein, partial [Alphaproteobacteria bacterium]|nr:NAD(P)H-binding protein [Alphaproteobacteria bacterium]